MFKHSDYKQLSIHRGKHRKWDDPTPRSREKCLEAAKEAAAKVFSRLLAEGKINPEDENKEPPPMTVKKEESTVKVILAALEFGLFLAAVIL